MFLPPSIERDEAVTEHCTDLPGVVSLVRGDQY